MAAVNPELCCKGARDPFEISSESDAGEPVGGGAPEGTGAVAVVDRKVATPDVPSAEFPTTSGLATGLLEGSSRGCVVETRTVGTQTARRVPVYDELLGRFEQAVAILDGMACSTTGGVGRRYEPTDKYIWVRPVEGRPVRIAISDIELRAPGSMLSALASGRTPSEADEQGAFVVNLSGEELSAITTYLRHGILTRELPPEYLGVVAGSMCLSELEAAAAALAAPEVPLAQDLVKDVRAQVVRDFHAIVAEKLGRKLLGSRQFAIETRNYANHECKYTNCSCAKTVLEWLKAPAESYRRMGYRVRVSVNNLGSFKGRFNESRVQVCLFPEPGSDS